MQTQTILVSDLPAAVYPPCWGGSIFTGLIKPIEIDPKKIFSSAYKHHLQSGEEPMSWPTGHEIMSELANNYFVGQDEPGKMYEAERTDGLNGHWGFRELQWLAKNWQSEFYQHWKGECLWGYGDVFREKGEGGQLIAPVLVPEEGKTYRPPVLIWIQLHHKVGPASMLLRSEIV